MKHHPPLFFIKNRGTHMSDHPEIEQFLRNHLNTIRENDVEGYHASTADDLTLYEWWVTPHRIEGLGFHDFLITENAKKGTTFGSESEPGIKETSSRYDLSNLKVQRYGDTAIASYTLLTTTSSTAGIKVVSHNESRVMAKREGGWEVVHVHKSPSWQAPHQLE
jgi:ketosteroid isomerase-like protein